MKQTTDYSMFKRHPNNRAINALNVDKIKRSIQVKNLLEYRPIIVDKNMQIIDGQHRLEAAKILNLPVFYQVQEQTGTEDIFLLNANQKAWNNEDFNNYYASKGIESYVKLKSFMEKSGLPLKDAFAVLGVHRGGKETADFKEGRFEFPPLEMQLRAEAHLENIKLFIEYVTQKTAIRKSSISSSSLKRALVYFFNLKDLNFDLFMHKLERKLELFRPCTKTRDYLDVFASIYNWKNQNPIDTTDIL